MELLHNSPTARSRLPHSSSASPWPTRTVHSHERMRASSSGSLVIEKVVACAGALTLTPEHEHRDIVAKLRALAIHGVGHDGFHQLRRGLVSVPPQQRDQSRES